MTDTDATQPAAASARKDALAAAMRAGVTVSMLDTSGAAAAEQLFRDIWGTPAAEQPLMVALRHSGAYVAGAFRSTQLVGACVGYFSQPLGEALHSHVAGVATSAMGSGVGIALKLHQRAWALNQGLTQITWTFDPLVSRNARFNINRLGVEVAEYLPDFYGDMSDGINAGQGSDRLFVRWHLDRALPSEPPPERHGAVTVAVPPDIESLRRSDPDSAAQWRHDVRAALAPPLASGLRVTSFHHHAYSLERP